MKKIILLLILSFSVNSNELGGMVKVATLDDGTHIYIDVNTIDNDGSYLNVWGQIIYPEPNDEGSISTRYKSEIDCSNKSDRVIYIEGFTKNADRVFASFVEEPTHTESEPGTNGRKVIDFVCN